MQKSTTELKKFDVFRHLNGKLLQVTSVEHAAHDNYKVHCIDNNNKTKFFIVDVHTQFDVVMTYSKVGA